MYRTSSLAAITLIAGSFLPVWSQDRTGESAKKAPDGIYAVQRESLKQKDVLPLKDGEVMLINNHRYLNIEDQEPPGYVVVHSRPDVPLDLAGEPKAVKEGEATVRILFRLQPRAAKALEQLTGDRRVQKVTVVVGGEIVTVHKVRAAIKNGEVQVTSCAGPAAADYLLGQLQAHQNKK
jgi:hypothetical protein